MNSEKQQIIAIPLEEYKELLIIKGKYEELSKKYPTLQFKENELNTGEHTLPYEPIPPYGTKIYS